jgi:bifunctional non-homologous end joining protein LigD
MNRLKSLAANRDRELQAAKETTQALPAAETPAPVSVGNVETPRRGVSGQGVSVRSDAIEAPGALVPPLGPPTPITLSLGEREAARPGEGAVAGHRSSGRLEASRSLPEKVKGEGAKSHVLSSNEEIENELLEGRADKVSIEIDGKRLQLTNLPKVYFPESGYTKRDLIGYYYLIADYILPHLKDRPLVLRRYPNGITGKSFFQKDTGEAIPEWLETVDIYSEDLGREHPYFICNDRASLLYLTNLGCIDHNPWPSRRDDLEKPDYFFFDLDPSEGTEFSTVVAVARALYERLQALGVAVFPKTSGSTGFHLYVPVERRYTFEQVRTFADIVGRLVAAKVPDLVTYERMVKKRSRGTVLIDAHQNAFGRPLAAPYSVRAFPKAPVSTPVTADEMVSSLRADRFNIETIRARLEKRGDLWADFWSKRQRLEKAIEAVSGQL